MQICTEAYVFRTARKITNALNCYQDQTQVSEKQIQAANVPGLSSTACKNYSLSRVVNIRRTQPHDT